MKDQNHVQLHRLRGLAVLGVVMVLGVACGGSDSASTETNAPATTEGSVTSDPVENVSNRDGQTIKVGVVNNDSLLPAFRIGAEVAIAAINAGGGINGAQIEVVSCVADASPEGSINCANQMIEENVAIAYTALDLGSDAAIPIYDEA